MIKRNFKFFFTFTLVSIISLANVAQSTQTVSNWVKPVDGTIANPFGHGYNFFGYYRAGHTGIDIKAKIGSKVVAVDDGIVKFIKTKHNMRYGNYIVIQHPNGLCSLYGHLLKVMVKENQQVKKGDQIALTGVSGLASYPHLHFEVTDKVPIRDGAWGYNYICKIRRIKDKSEKDKEILLAKQIYDLVPLEEIQDKFNFMDTPYKFESHFYRMKDDHCIEKPIAPLTYFNPENYLPRYERSVMPDFNRRLIVKKPVSKEREKTISTKLKNNPID